MLQSKYYDPGALAKYQEKLQNNTRRTFAKRKLPAPELTVELSRDEDTGYYTARFETHCREDNLPERPPTIDVDEWDKEEHSLERWQTNICRDLRRMDATRLHNLWHDTPGFRNSAYSEEKGVVEYTAPSLETLLKGMNNWLLYKVPTITEPFKPRANEAARKNFAALEAKRDLYPESLLKTYENHIAATLETEMEARGVKPEKRQLMITLEQNPRSKRCILRLESPVQEMRGVLRNILESKSDDTRNLEANEESEYRHDKRSFRKDKETAFGAQYSAKNLSQLLNGLSPWLTQTTFQTHGLAASDAVSKMSL